MPYMAWGWGGMCDQGYSSGSDVFQNRGRISIFT